MKVNEKNLVRIGVLLFLAALFGWNGVLELRAEEPRRAIVSLEMWLTGNFWVPRIHDWSYYNKPPVFNWLMLFFFNAFGSAQEWVVRMPSLLAFVSLCWVLYRVAGKHLGRETGLLSAVFLATSGDILFYGSVNAGEIDLFFSFLVCCQAIALFTFHQRGRYLAMFVVSYLLAALGTLTKGPPSIAFQALTLVPWLLVHRQWKLLLGWRHACGIAAFVIMVGGYFMIYGQQDDAPGFMVRLFKEASQRTGMEHRFADTLIGAAAFPFKLIQWMAPWSLFAVFLFRKKLVGALRSRPLLWFSVLFIVFNIPLYWFTADHKVRYLYMFFPFFFILVAWGYTHLAENRDRWREVMMNGFGVLMAIATLGFVAMPFIPALAIVPGIAAKAAVLFAGGIALCLLYRKRKALRVYLFASFLVLLRLGFNVSYLPAAAGQSTSMVYRSHVQQVLDITGGEPVHWTGEPYVFESDASIGPVTLEKARLTSAPLVAYQVPYYLTLGNGHIMTFDTTLARGRYYLAHGPVPPDRAGPVLYRFKDLWMDRELILFRAK